MDTNIYPWETFGCPGTLDATTIFNVFIRNGKVDI